jgi:SAM-dependent methyltransferase
MRLPLLQRAKTPVRAALELEPRVGVRILRLLRSLQSRRLRRSLRAGGRWALREAPSTVCDVLSVPPASIVHCSLIEFGPQDSRSAVVPGDWDRSQKAFSDSNIFRAMKSVLKDQSCAWADTPWYAQVLSRVEAGQTVWNCRSEADLQRRVADVERLYWSTPQEGHRSQVQLAERDPSLATSDEVGVAIGRGGELLCCDGAHRLCIALLLGIDEIPVRVRVRHPGWATFRDELLAYARFDGGSLYQPALHCDLASIPSSPRCEDRWRLISSKLERSGGKVLDIGANLGFFDNKLEDLGYDCTAVENDVTLAHFMRGIRDANGHRFEIVADSLSAHGLLEGRHFDVVLALSVLHHFLKTRYEYALLERFLGELKCNEMFFEPHVSGESQMAGAYSHLTPEAFTQHVAGRTGLALIETLGVASDYRTVYHLRRVN